MPFSDGVWFDPADRRRQVGEVSEADAAAVDQALARAVRAQADRSAGGAEARADCLTRASDMMEQDGIIGPADGSKAREILVAKDYYETVDNWQK